MRGEHTSNLCPIYFALFPPEFQVQEILNELDATTKVAIGRSILKETEVVCATCVGVGAPVTRATFKKGFPHFALRNNTKALPR